MEQKIILKNQNQCILKIRESNLDFYLIIPNSRKVEIVLGLFDNVSDEMVSSFPIQNNRSIVIPVIPEQILLQSNMIGTRECNYVDQVLAFLINTVYKILTANQIEVEKQILLNQNENLNVFQQNFITKYQGRVKSVEMFPKTSEKIVPEIVNSANNVTGGVNLETKLSSEPMTALDLNEQERQNENNATSMEEVMPTEEMEPKKLVRRKENSEPGFVSYVLLGVVVAIATLIFLYFII